MKKFLALILAVSMTISFAACGSKDYAAMTADDLLSNIKDQQKVTLDEYVELISTYSNVNITEDMELENNITSEAISKLRENGAEFPPAEEYIKTLLASESPQVRGYAMSSVSSMLGVNDDNLAAVKEVLKTETDPYVICCALGAVGNEGGKDAEIGTFLLNSAKNENSKVREKTAMALGSSWNKSLEGAVDTMIALMSDSDVEVRKAAYRYAGKLEDERIIEPISTMLKNPDDKDLHGDGVESLVSLWYDYPFHEKTSEAAYKATMDYLKTTSTSPDIPQWTAVSSFSNKNDDHFAEWRQKATYFNPDEIAQTMTTLVQNTNLNWIARTAAVKVVAVHCSKEAFDSLGTVVNGLTDDKAKYILDEYNTQAKNIK
ncbi:MAG: HEAT repeat domain-containing protein [Lachnospirales bacterium]